MRTVVRECMDLACGEAAALRVRSLGLGLVEDDVARASGQFAGRAGFDGLVDGELRAWENARLAATEAVTAPPEQDTSPVG